MTDDLLWAFLAPLFFVIGLLTTSVGFVAVIMYIGARVLHHVRISRLRRTREDLVRLHRLREERRRLDAEQDAIETLIRETQRPA